MKDKSPGAYQAHLRAMKLKADALKKTPLTQPKAKPTDIERLKAELEQLRKEAAGLRKQGKPRTTQLNRGREIYKELGLIDEKDMKARLEKLRQEAIKDKIPGRPKPLAPPNPKLPTYTPDGRGIPISEAPDYNQRRFEQIRERVQNTAKSAVRSNSTFSKVRSAVANNPVVRAAGRAASAVGRSASGRAIGTVVSKTAVPLMIAQGAYDAGRTIHEGYKAAKAGQEAKSNAEYMQKNYGSVEAATETRHRKAREKKEAADRRKRQSETQLRQGELMK